MNEISVVIPLYNKAPHIDRSLNSVLSQTVLPKEIIVVDDGSTDGGGEIVKNFNHPLIRLIRKKNEGVSATRNRGVLEATGSLVAFLDADDYWQPRFLETIYHLRIQFPQAGIYATNFEVVLPNGEIKKNICHCLPSDSQEGLITYIDVFDSGPINSSTIAIPKNVLQEVGGFNPDEYLYEDMDLFLRIGLLYPIAWNNKPLARYHQDAVNRALGTRLRVKEPAVSVTTRQAIAEGLVPEEHINFLREEYSNKLQIQAAVHCIYQGKKEMASQLLAFSRITKKYRSLWWQCFILNLLPGRAGSFILRSKKRITELLGVLNY